MLEARGGNWDFFHRSECFCNPFTWFIYLLQTTTQWLNLFIPRKSKCTGSYISLMEIYPKLKSLILFMLIYNETECISKG